MGDGGSGNLSGVGLARVGSAGAGLAETGLAGLGPAGMGSPGTGLVAAGSVVMAHLRRAARISTSPRFPQPLRSRGVSQFPWWKLVTRETCAAEHDRFVWLARHSVPVFRQ